MVYYDTDIRLSLPATCGTPAGEWRCGAARRLTPDEAGYAPRLARLGSALAGRIGKTLRRHKGNHIPALRRLTESAQPRAADDRARSLAARGSSLSVNSY